jgi:uncharacterized protein (DUF2235 family)
MAESRYTDQTGDRNFIICIDGTANDPIDVNITNVLKFHRAVEQTDNQEAHYYAGVGNEEDYDKLGQKLGYILGWGARGIRKKVYADLVADYQPGDKIFILGFSRGAAIARMLAVYIDKKGVKGAKVDIEMLGVWDTVASFGIPLNILGIPFQQVNLFRDFTIANNIKKAYHLVAVDETRGPFQATLMNTLAKVEEIWFPGLHSDIGGGFAEIGLSDICLNFMINRAKEHGVVFRQSALDQLKPDATCSPPRYFPDKTGIREIVVLSNNEKTDRPPKIHHTVLDQMEAFGAEYQPQNVLDLGDKYQLIETD